MAYTLGNAFYVASLVIFVLWFTVALVTLLLMATGRGRPESAAPAEPQGPTSPGLPS